jgi:hypothetical protein
LLRASPGPPQTLQDALRKNVPAERRSNLGYSVTWSQGAVCDQRPDAAISKAKGPPDNSFEPPFERDIAYIRQSLSSRVSIRAGKGRPKSAAEVNARGGHSLLNYDIVAAAPRLCARIERGVMLMGVKYILLSCAALGMAAVVTTVAQATPFAGAGARPGTDNLAIVVKDEEKRVHHGGHGCGPFMYRKGGKCVDARNKK